MVVSEKRKAIMSEENNKKYQAIQKDWERGFGIVTPENLQEMRYILRTVYPINKADVSCNIHEFTMEWEIKFSFWRTLFKSKRKLKKDMEKRLVDYYDQYEVKIKEV